MDAPTLDNEFFGLDYLLADVDPKLSFSTTDEIPAEIGTADRKRAAEMLGKFLEIGLFKPGIGFTSQYQKVMKKMGSLEYLFEQPSEKHAIFVSSKNNRNHIDEITEVAFEYTKEIMARPNNNGQNPAMVIVNDAIPLKDVSRLYDRSTVLYLATTMKEKAAIEKTLTEELTAGIIAVDGVVDEVAINQRVQALIVDISQVNGDEEKRNLIGNHLSFVNARRAKGEEDLGEMIVSELKEAKELISKGNEHFYDVREELEALGRRVLVDEMVEKGEYKMPLRTDHELVMLFSGKKDGLTKYGMERHTRKKVRSYINLPPVEETGMPFVIITDKAITKSQIQEQFPSATVLYLASTAKKEAAIHKANPDGDVLVFNAEGIKAQYNGWHDDNKDIFVGKTIVNSLFKAIGEGRAEGVNEMVEIGKRISDRVKKSRDELLFATSLRDQYGTAREYYNLQEQYAATPTLLQLTDGVLMETCPTGGCFQHGTPDTGGCCGGGNIPGVMIDFAIAYRQQVGDAKFAEELKANHGGKIKEPWYFGTRSYQRHFKDLGQTALAGTDTTKTTTDDLTF